jgi:DNA-binding beta-propeller fold protein YncE
VYVADAWNYRIQYFTPDGSFLGKWGSGGRGNGEFIRPNDLAFAANGNIYVVEMGDRVQYFTPTGSFLGKWGQSGNRSHEFDRPHGIAISKSGGDFYYANVYVADTGNSRIKYYFRTGSGDWGGLHYPHGVDVSPWNGNVYVSDTFDHRIQYFTSTGSFLGKWGGSGNGKFHEPHDVAFAPDGLVYVADTGNHRIQYFTPRGSFVGKWSLVPGSSHPNGIAFNATGSRCYVATHFDIQYYNRNAPAVSPASLGKVKALFR